MASTHNTTTAHKAPQHMASLGSSFAAGPAIPPQANPHANRSGANYASIVARNLSAKLTDLTVSGATLLNLLEEPQVTGRNQHTFAPQISELPADADLVLVLGGGNDLGYARGVFLDSFRAYWLGRLLLRVFGEPAAAAAPLDVDTLSARYGTVLDAVHAKAPGAVVLVVEYTALFGPDTRAGVDVPFDARRLECHQEVAEQLLKATRKAVQGREEWCSVVPVAEVSLKHGIGAKEPWVSGWGWGLLFKGGAYHPNAEGMKGVAGLIQKKLVEMGMAPQ